MTKATTKKSTAKKSAAPSSFILNKQTEGALKQLKKARDSIGALSKVLAAAKKEGDKAKKK